MGKCHRLQLPYRRLQYVVHSSKVSFEADIFRCFARVCFLQQIERRFMLKHLACVSSRFHYLQAWGKGRFRNRALELEKRNALLLIEVLFWRRHCRLMLHQSHVRQLCQQLSEPLNLQPLKSKPSRELHANNLPLHCRFDIS
jgi:hypothetical protein